VKREPKSQDPDLPTVTNVRVFTKEEARTSEEDSRRIGAWNFCGVVTFSDGKEVEAFGDFTWSLKIRLRSEITSHLAHLRAVADGKSWEQRLSRKAEKTAEKLKDHYS
jgi:hypothetical protein